MQAFEFALETPPAAQATLIERSFGARRYAHNWAVAQIQADLDRFRDTSEQTAAPSLAGLRKRWNQDKHTVAVDTATGAPWWCSISKEVFNDGIGATVDAYWNWQKSRSGEREGPRVGFPRFHRKNRRRDSFTICQPSLSRQGIRIEDNRHLRIPVIGVVRTCETMRKLARPVERGTARILAVTVTREGGRLKTKLRVEILRPQRHHKPSDPASRVGVDVGERVLAVVAAADGTITERVPNPAPLKQRLTELRRLNRKLARQQRGSNGWHRTRTKMSRLHHKIVRIRRDALHKLTTRLAKTHGSIVIEQLNVAGMRKGGAKHLRDANLGEFQARMQYKCGWYGSTLVVADRWFPSSKTCSTCGHVQNIGKDKRWVCDICETSHDRDDNAAVNLARYEPDNAGLVKSRRACAVRSSGGTSGSGTGRRPNAMRRQPDRRAKRPSGATPQGVSAK